MAPEDRFDRMEKLVEKAMKRIGAQGRGGKRKDTVCRLIHLPTQST